MKMVKVSKSKNIALLRPLLIFGNLLCICPPVNHTLENRCIPLFYKVYVACIIVVTIICNALVIYRKEMFLGEALPSPVRCIDYLLHVGLTIFSLYVCLSSCFLHGKEICEFLVDIDKVDTKLRNEKIDKCKFQILLLFAGLNILLAVFIISDAAIWVTTLGFGYYQYYVIRVIQFYHTSVTIFFGTVYSMQLCERIYALNQLLWKNRFSAAKNDAFINIGGDILDKQYYLKEIQKLHTRLCDMVDKLNKIFGLIFVFGAVTCIFMELNFIVLIVAFSFCNLSIEGHNNYGILFICVVGMAIVFVQMASLAYVGETVKNESSKTHQIAYALINVLPPNPSATWQKNLRAELLVLAMQTAFRKPEIEGRGFFVVNYKMIGFIVASLTSYVIVAVQFLAQMPAKAIHPQRNNTLQ